MLFERKVCWGILVALAVVTVAVPSTAAVDEADETSRYVVDAIQIRGVHRTRRATILRLLELEAGQRISVRELEQRLERLRGTGAFADIDYEILDWTVPRPDGTNPSTDHRILRLDLRERWTTVPLVSIDRGGNLDSLTLGLRETNAFGHLLELGVRYRRLDSTDSVEGWARAPHMPVRRLTTALQFGWTNRPRRLYAPDGRLVGGYLRRRAGIELSASWEWAPTLATGLTLRGRDDAFSLEVIDERAVSRQRRRGLPSDRRTLAPRIHARFGDPAMGSGGQPGLIYRQYLQLQWTLADSRPPIVEAVGEARWNTALPFDSVLAGRFAVGFSNAEHVEDFFFVGGLSDVRGFVDSRFRGRHHWFGNLELRVPSLANDKVVLQHVAFADATGVADRASQLWVADGVASGLGLRIVLPGLNHFTLRFDYAWTPLGDGRAPISFGTSQQF